MKMYLLKTSHMAVNSWAFFFLKTNHSYEKEFSFVIVNEFLIFVVVYSFKRKYILYKTSTSMFANINIMHGRIFPLNREDKYSPVIILCYKHLVLCNNIILICEI